MFINIMHCGVITSFIYTVVYIAKNDIIIDYYYFKNINFQKEITAIFDKYLEKYSFSFLSIFLGPAPLMSLRASLIFMQGLYFSFKIPIVVLSGNSLYKSKLYDIIIIQNFCGNYLLIEKRNKNKFNTLLEIEEKNYLNKKIALVAREGHNIVINNNYVSLLFPNIENFALLAYKKYQSKKYIKDFTDIVPFF